MYSSYNALGPIVTGVLVNLLRERLRGWALGIAGVWVLGEIADVIRNSRRVSPAGAGRRLPGVEPTIDRS